MSIENNYQLIHEKIKWAIQCRLYVVKGMLIK